MALAPSTTAKPPTTPPRNARRGPAAGAVTTRRLIEPVEDRPTMLYQPVPQIDDPKVMKVTWPWITPDKAAEWISEAGEDSEFRQRPTRPNEVRRWKLLQETDRFVHFLPAGPICRDPEGRLINGKHRLTAVSEGLNPVGFMVVSNVPRWMFPFFDTGKGRTIDDVFYVSGRMSKAQSGSTMRLAMRYEEFLWGLRSELNWKEWSKVNDEHSDVDLYCASHQDLADLYMVADQCYRGGRKAGGKGSRLIIASLMVFRHFQIAAWPEGEHEVVRFFEQLTTGADVGKNSPPLVLRDWSREIASTRERITAKREMHLLLLFNAFNQSMRKERILNGKQRAAHGMPMPLPYHPKGPQVALANVREAMARRSVPTG